MGSARGINLGKLTDAAAKTLRSEYFADDGLRAYMLIDGASAGALIDHLYDDGADFACLITGGLEPDMQEVAPYLVALSDGEPFANWVVDNSQGAHWGIILRSSLALPDLARRYRKLLRVRGSDGDSFFFRFYDPRVFRAYLPSCQPDELEVWFDEVRCYLMEAQDPDILLRLSANQNALKMEEILLRSETY
jgi:hypothetical protein